MNQYQMMENNNDIQEFKRPRPVSNGAGRRGNSIYADAMLVFFSALLGVLFLLALWARLIAGSWLAVNFQNEFPKALIFSAVFASLIVVWRHAPTPVFSEHKVGREAKPEKQVWGQAPKSALIIFGLGLIAFEVFMELPIKKYVLIHPELALSITLWFFLFGLAEFVGISLVLSGFYNWQRGKRENSNFLFDRANQLYQAKRRYKIVQSKNQP